MNEEVYYPVGRCWNCSTFYPRNNKFCNSCGAKLYSIAIFCSKCSAALKRSEKCKSCKTKLSTEFNVDESNLDNIMAKEKEFLYTEVNKGLLSRGMKFNTEPIMQLLRKKLQFLPTLQSFVEGKGHDRLLSDYELTEVTTGEMVFNEIFNAFSSAVAIGFPSGDVMQRMMSLMFLGKAGKYLELVPSFYPLGIGVEQPEEVAVEERQEEEKTAEKQTDGPFNMDGHWNCKCNSCGREWKAMQMSFDDGELQSTDIMGDKDKCSCGSTNISSNFAGITDSMKTLESAFGDDVQKRMHAAAESIISGSSLIDGEIPSKAEIDKNMMEMMSITLKEPKFNLLVKTCVDYLNIILELSKLGIDYSKKMTTEDQIYEFPFRYDGNLRDEFIIYHSLHIGLSEKEQQNLDNYRELADYLYLYGKAKRSDNFIEFILSSIELTFQIINECWRENEYAKYNKNMQFLIELLPSKIEILIEHGSFEYISDHVQFIFEQLEKSEQITTNMVHSIVQTIDLVYRIMKVHKQTDDNTKDFLKTIAKIY